MPRHFPALFLLLVAVSLPGGSSALEPWYPNRNPGGKDITQPLGRMSQPFANGLNFRTFHSDDLDTSERVIGEVLEKFDVFLQQQGISYRGTVTDLNRLYSLISRDYALATGREASLDDAYDELKDELKDLAEDIVDEDEDADLSTYLSIKAKAESLRARRNLLRRYLRFEKPLLVQLRAARASPENERLRKEACDTAIRVIYTLMSEQFLDADYFSSVYRSKKDKKSIIRHFIGRAELNATRYHTSRTWDCPIGPFAANKEANDLYRPCDPTRFVSPDTIKKLSHYEVAHLDVAPTNPMWYTHAKMASDPVDVWSELEHWISCDVTEELLDKKKFKKEFPDFRYSLHRARQVLFWDGVKATASSPKINVVDAFDQEWKLKWGDEALIEPISNRLRLLLGTKFTDLVYPDVGGGAHMLILPSAIQKSMAPEKEMPLTVAEFIAVMKNSKYEFNVRPFILASGVITEENEDQILAELPEEALKGFRKKQIRGRVWIRFKESMVEAKHDAVRTGGPITLHTDNVMRSRAHRQSMIMSFWMADTDVKEDNHRGVWVSNFGGHQGPQYLEWLHDLGSSLGGLRRSGEVNHLTPKHGTSEFLWVGPSGFTMHSNAIQLYRPGAFDQVTFADQLAGARHIARLTQRDIARCVRASLMPDFYQQCLVWKLTKRRDIIARYYGLTLRDGPAGPPPDVVIPMSSREDRQRAAARYRIPLHEIEKDLIRTGKLSASAPHGDTFEPFDDVVVKKGQILADEENVITGILRDYRHPPGFTERTTRGEDGRPWQSRRYGLERKEP